MAKIRENGIAWLMSGVRIAIRSLPHRWSLYLDSHNSQDRCVVLLAPEGDLFVSRLVDVLGPVCLLCAARRSENCHRSLIAQHLALAADNGIEPLMHWTNSSTIPFALAA